MFARKLIGAVCIVSLLSLASPARAQFGGLSPGTVSGTGSVKIERQPSLARMTIQLSEQAESLQDALAKLKDRREAAVLQLEALKATNISVTDPGLSVDTSSQKRQMERMIMQQLRGQGRRVPKGLDVPELVTVGAAVTAEWPLEFQSGEELLLLAKELTDRVEQADLAGVNEPKELSPEQRELAEEMQAAMSEYGYGQEPAQPGKPKFVYVGRISDEERASALAEAFKKAKVQAGRLAQAAGSQLGELASIAGATGQGAEAFEEYEAYARLMMMQQGQPAVGAVGEDEAVSPQAGKVTFNITVTAAFQLR